MDVDGSLPYGALFAGGFAYAGYRTLGRWLAPGGDSARERQDAAFFQSVDMVLARGAGGRRTAAAAPARPHRRDDGAGGAGVSGVGVSISLGDDGSGSGSDGDDDDDDDDDDQQQQRLGAGAAATGQGHLWDDWRHLAPAQRASLLSGMLGVLQLTGQDARWRHLQRLKGGEPWQQLTQTQRGELVWAADALDWSFVAAAADAGAAPAAGPLIWQVTDPLPQLEAEPALARRPRALADGLAEKAGKLGPVLDAALAAARRVAAVRAAPLTALGSAGAARGWLAELRGALQGGLGLGAGGRAQRLQELVELLAAVDLTPACPVAAQVHAGALQELADEAAALSSAELAEARRAQRDAEMTAFVGAVSAALLECLRSARLIDPVTASALLLLGCDAVAEPLEVVYSYATALLPGNASGAPLEAAAAAAATTVTSADPEALLMPPPEVAAGVASVAALVTYVLSALAGALRGPPPGGALDAGKGARGAWPPAPPLEVAEAMRVADKLRAEVDLELARRQGGGGGSAALQKQQQQSGQQQHQLEQQQQRHFLNDLSSSSASDTGQSGPDAVPHRLADTAARGAAGSAAAPAPEVESTGSSMLGPCIAALRSLARNLARVPAPPGVAPPEPYAEVAASDPWLAVQMLEDDLADAVGERVTAAVLPLDVATREKAAAAQREALRQVVARRAAAVDSGDAAALAAAGLDDGRPAARYRRLALLQVRLRGLADGPSAAAMSGATSLLAAIEGGSSVGSYSGSSSDSDSSRSSSSSSSSGGGNDDASNASGSDDASEGEYEYGGLEGPAIAMCGIFLAPSAAASVVRARRLLEGLRAADDAMALGFGPDLPARLRRIRRYVGRLARRLQREEDEERWRREASPAAGAAAPAAAAQEGAALAPSPLAPSSSSGGVGSSGEEQHQQQQQQQQQQRGRQARQEAGEGSNNPPSRSPSRAPSSSDPFSSAEWQPSRKDELAAAMQAATLADELARCGVVALGLTGHQVSALSALRGAVAAMRGGAAPPAEYEAAVDDVRRQLPTLRAAIGAAVAGKLRGDGGGGVSGGDGDGSGDANAAAAVNNAITSSSSKRATERAQQRTALEAAKRLLIEGYGAAQALVTFETALRAPALAALRCVAACADAVAMPAPAGSAPFTRDALRVARMAEEHASSLARLVARLPTPTDAPELPPARARKAAAARGKAVAGAAELANLAAALAKAMSEWAALAMLRTYALAALGSPAARAVVEAWAGAGEGPAPPLRLPLRALADLAPQLNAPLYTLPDASPDERAAWALAGLQAAARGHVACVVLATGLVPTSSHGSGSADAAAASSSSSGRLPRARVIEPVPGLPSRKSCLQLYAERILRLQALAAEAAQRGGSGKNGSVRRPVPFVIATTPTTHASVAAALERSGYYGLDKSQVLVVECGAGGGGCGSGVCLDAGLRVARAAPGALAAAAPPSPGAMLAALKRLGALAWLSGRGVKHVEFNAVDDNVLWRPADPMALGLALALNAPAAAKVVEPTDVAGAYASVAAAAASAAAAGAAAAAVGSGNSSNSSGAAAATASSAAAGAVATAAAEAAVPQETPAYAAAAAGLVAGVAAQAPAIGAFLFTLPVAERVAAAAALRLAPAAGVPQLRASAAATEAEAAHLHRQLDALNAVLERLGLPPEPADAAPAIAAATDAIGPPPRLADGYALRPGLAGALRAGPRASGLGRGEVVLFAVARSEEFATPWRRGPHWPGDGGGSDVVEGGGDDAKEDNATTTAAERLLALHASWLSAAGVRRRRRPARRTDGTAEPAAAHALAGCEVSPLESYAGEGLAPARAPTRRRAEQPPPAPAVPAAVPAAGDGDGAGLADTAAEDGAGPADTAADDAAGPAGTAVATDVAANAVQAALVQGALDSTVAEVASRGDAGPRYNAGRWAPILSVAYLTGVGFIIAQSVASTAAARAAAGGGNSSSLYSLSVRRQQQQQQQQRKSSSNSGGSGGGSSGGGGAGHTLRRVATAPARGLAVVARATKRGAAAAARTSAAPLRLFASLARGKGGRGAGSGNGNGAPEPLAPQPLPSLLPPSASLSAARRSSSSKKKKKKRAEAAAS